MERIHIVKKSVTKLDVDCVVNAANEGLWAGGGVCGAIFKEAGYNELTDACTKIGHCDTGNAVITPGFRCGWRRKLRLCLDGRNWRKS